MTEHPEVRLTARPGQQRMWLIALSWLCLSVTSVYFLGALHLVASQGDAQAQTRLASHAQGMPLLYVAAFIALPRGAAAFSWLHFAGVLGLYGLHFARPAWNGLLPPEGHALAHTWFIMLLTQPCYILALQYVTLLKKRLIESESKAHADKQHFLAMLSHEIRSPLQAMLGSIDLLALKVPQGPEKRAVDRLRHATDQLETHLRDVTEFTRLEDPAWQLHVATVDLCRLLRETCESWQPEAAAKGLTLRCEIAPDAHATLQQWRTDPQRVRQILVKLLSHAVKSTPSGHVTVHAQVAAGKQHWLLEITGTEIGTPKADGNCMVEPSAHPKNAHAGHTEGSGLGLAIVQELVTRLQGELHIDSHPEHGSCFSVRLPRAN